MIVSQVLDELGISLDHELSDITPGLEKPHVASTGQVGSIICIISDETLGINILVTYKQSWTLADLFFA